MPKIPQVQGEQLPSSAVGVPSLDTSPLQMAGQLENSANNAAQFELQGASQERGQANANIERQQYKQAGAFNGIGNEIEQRQFHHQLVLQGEQARQDALTREQMRLQNESKAASHIARATIGMDDLYSKAQQAAAGNSQALPGIVDSQLQNYVTQYAKQNPDMNPEVQATFNKTMAERMTQYHKSANDYMVSQGNVEAKALFQDAATQLADNAQNGRDAYKQAITQLYAPPMQKNVSMLYGAAVATKVLAAVEQKAAKNFLGAAAEEAPDTLLGDNPRSLDLVGSTLTRDQMQPFVNKAIARKNAIDADNRAQQAAVDSVTVLQAHAIVNAARDDGTTKGLQAGLNTIDTALQAEEQKPIFQSKDPVSDMQGRAIQYRSLKAVEVYEKKRNELEAQIRQNEREAKALAHEADKDAKAAAKDADMQDQINIAGHKAQADTMYQNGAPKLAKLQGLINALESSGIPKHEATTTVGGNPNPANPPKVFQATPQQVALYRDAAYAYHDAMEAGAIDDPNRKKGGAKLSAGMLHQLQAIGTTLVHSHPNPGFAPDLSKAHGQLSNFAAAPPALHQVLSLYAHYSKVSVNREFTAEMLDRYDTFVEANGHPPTKSSTIEKWKNGVMRDIANKYGMKSALGDE